MYFVSIEDFDVNNLIVKLNNHLIELLYNYDNNNMITDLILEIPWSNKNYISDFIKTNEIVKKICVSKKNIYYEKINSVYEMIYKKIEEVDKNSKINKLQSNYKINPETKINLIENSRRINSIESKDINFDNKDYFNTELNLYFTIKAYYYESIFIKNELVALNIKPKYFNKKYVENKLVEKIRICDYQDNQISI